MKKLTIIAVILLVIIAGCQKGPYSDYEQTETGLYYKITRGNSDKALPAVGDVLNVEMAYYACNEEKEDSLIYSTEGNNPIMIPVQKPFFKGDLSEGLLMITEGDSASFIVKADSFLTYNVRLKEMPPFIKQETMFRFEIKVLNHKTAQEYSEEMKVVMEKQMQMLEELKKQEAIDRDNWLKENNIKVKPTQSGLYFIGKEEGTGDKIKQGDKVYAHYTGYFLNGQKFDSSEGNKPFSFVAGLGEVIQGWDEAVMMMRKGGKSRIIVPSELAYGQSKPNFPIPPYSTLYFDVEIVDVERK